MNCYKASRFAFVVLSVCFLTFAEVRAGDWPQILGPARNGISNEAGLISKWSKNGPPVLWKKDVGEGFSGPVVAGEKLILFHRKGNQEIVECLSAKTGAPIWKFAYACNYVDGYNKGNGPRSTPAIAGGNVYALGVDGQLHCLDLKTGTKKWNVSLLKAYKVPGSFFGIGTSPIVVNNKVLINVGGQGAGIVAFDAKNGKELWRETDHQASYSSPTLATIGNKTRAVFLTRRGAVLLDPANGKVLYEQRWRARYAASVNAATPLVIGNVLFFSSSYETGALVLKANGNKVTEMWKGDEIMSNHFNTCIHHKGHLYGIHGRQEALQAKLRCIELKSGKVKWTKSRYGCASMILANGKLIALTEQGDLVSILPTPTGYRELARVTVFSDTPCRAEIALANGRLYARDGSVMKCWNLRKR